jgi:microsomal dipeptidase-like Zn-dependent dipeptidase
MSAQQEPVRFDFATGDLSCWTAEGDAFTDQPVQGDIVKASQVNAALVPLGGDYWDGPYPVGQPGDYWIHTQDALTGTLTSDEFTISAAYPWFSLLIGGGDDVEHLRVELLVQKDDLQVLHVVHAWPSALLSLPDAGQYVQVFVATGHGREIMRRVSYHAASFSGARARLRILDHAQGHHLNVADLRFSAHEPETTPLAQGGGDPGAPVWGIADLHTHPMASLAFGGLLFWGEADGPIAEALGPCTSAHGLAGTGLPTPTSWGTGNVLLAYFESTGYQSGLQNWLHPGHAVGGYPSFDGWPRFTTIIHQQMYIDWIRRAYEGGLRVLVAHAVNNELLAKEFGGWKKKKHDDRTAVEVQLAAMKAFVARHSDWMEIACTPADARRIIRENRLAVVLGVEVDTLGNWPEERDCTIEELQAYLDHLYHDLGVRHLFPVHLINNALGGAAIYNDLFNVLNRTQRDHYFEVEDGSAQGVQYRLGDDPGPASLWYQNPLTFLLPPFGTQQSPLDFRKVTGGHINAQGLTAAGLCCIQQLMRLGMVIDTDHMSYKTVDAVLALAEQHGYPLVSGHTHFQALSWTREETACIHKCPNEYGKTDEQLARIRALGGMVAPILNQGDLREVGTLIPEMAGKVAPASSGSATSWAQAYLYAVAKMQGTGVGIGTDMNGFYKSPSPRFGMNASYYLHYHVPGMGLDPQRQGLRRAQIEAQEHGVCYDTPLKDVSPSRFTGVLEGEIYDDLERDFWQALGLYDAGLNPWQSERGLPASSRVKNLAKGLWAEDEQQLMRISPLLPGHAPQEQRAAFFVKHGPDPARLAQESESVQQMVRLCCPIWQRWQAMRGTHRPLTRSYAGERDFDLNLDGVAHYGMLPDLWQDLKNVGLTDEDLQPLFRSAEAYIQVWERCEQRAEQIRLQAAAPEKQRPETSRRQTV